MDKDGIIDLKSLEEVKIVMRSIDHMQVGLGSFHEIKHVYRCNGKENTELGLLWLNRFQEYH